YELTPRRSGSAPRRWGAKTLLHGPVGSLGGERCWCRALSLLLGVFLCRPVHATRKTAVSTAIPPARMATVQVSPRATPRPAPTNGSRVQITAVLGEFSPGRAPPHARKGPPAG